MNAPNVPPTVSLTSPANGASFNAPAAVTLTATAADSDGTVSQVEFFHGGTNLIATVTSPPYTHNWTGVAAGAYTLTARATDNQNGTTVSAPVGIVVNQVAALYFIHSDHLNTPRLITNQVGQAVWQWDNADPFGHNAPNDNPSGLGVFTCNLRLPGQYFDPETNLHYNWMRDYDPAVGRYVESDLIGLRGSINTYVYVGNSPLRFSDPSGLEPWNGNVTPGFNKQQPGCDVAGVLPYFNSNECAIQCCADHDACYARFGCNSSSWNVSLVNPIAAAVFSRLPCPMCNATAVACLFSSPFRSCGKVCR